MIQDGDELFYPAPPFNHTPIFGQKLTLNQGYIYRNVHVKFNTLFWTQINTFAGK